MPAEFKIETQEKLNWCWAAVSATVSRFFFQSQALPQCSIAKNVLNLPPDIDCCHDPDAVCDKPAELLNALKSVNLLLNKSLKISSQTGVLSFENIRQNIDTRRLICARIHWFDENRSHFVMISGYSISKSKQQWINIADPYYEDSTVPYDQFVSAYLDAGNWTDTYLVNQ